MKRQCALAIPCAQSVDPETLQSIIDLSVYSATHGIEIPFTLTTERMLIDEARNHIAETFLQTPAEWLFWMDSDMTFPRETLAQLFDVAEKKDAKMVTGIYYQRKGLHYPCLWSRGEELDSGQRTGLSTPKAQSNKYMGTFVFPHPDKKEPFQVHAAGFGCVLIHRSVLEVTERPWFKFIKGMCSEDFYFFVNAQEMGFKLWAVPTIELVHLGDRKRVTKKDFYTNAAKADIEIEAIKK